VSVVILSTVSGKDKTTACQQVLRLGMAVTFRAAGLLSVPMSRDGEKTAIVLHEAHGRGWRILARAHG